MGSVNQSITINASVDFVWIILGDFHDMAWAPDVITGLEKVGNLPGNVVGAQRILNGVFHETLVEHDDELPGFAYQITDGPSPLSKEEVSNYFGRVTLKPVAGGARTLVEWGSTWEQNDGPVAEFCNGIYQALLGQLKRKCE